MCKGTFNFSLSAVEYGSQCFCGDAFNPDAHASKQPMSDCDSMKCPGRQTLCCCNCFTDCCCYAGNSSQSCGAADRMLVYHSKCTGTPVPNGHGCTTPASQKMPYCNPETGIEERINDLVSRLTLEEKIAMISPQPALGGTCACHTAGVARLGVPNYMWLVETNTAVASACMEESKCATTFSGPMGMGASFNRTSWYMKGSVIGTEMRAFSNANWHRGTSPVDLIYLTGYGPNINIARDPRFGRNSELPGEDPLLSGTYAAQMVSGMQQVDKNGHPKMIALLKHFTVCCCCFRR